MYIQNHDNEEESERTHMEHLSVLFPLILQNWHSLQLSNKTFKFTFMHLIIASLYVTQSEKVEIIENPIKIYF